MPGEHPTELKAGISDELRKRAVVSEVARHIQTLQASVQMRIVF